MRSKVPIQVAGDGRVCMREERVENWFRRSGGGGGGGEEVEEEVEGAGVTRWMWMGRLRAREVFSR